MRKEILPQRLKYLGERRIMQAVEGLVAYLARLDDVFVAENGEVLGGVRLLDADLFAELADGQLSVVKVLDDRDPGRVRESLEDFRLEPPH
jgi:hypothetical protein